MSNSSTIKIALKIDDQGGVRVLQNVGKESSSTGQKGKKAFNDMDRSAKSFNDSAKMSLNTMLKMGAGIAGVLGLAKAWGMLKDSAKEYVTLASVQEAAENKLEAVLKATGNAAGYNLSQLKAMASGLQDVTTMGDETTLAGMAILATFKEIKGEAFEGATKAAMDMSKVMDQDLKSSMVQIGKALNDPIQGLSALSRVGVSFTDDQKKMIKTLQESGDMMGAQKVILAELKSEFGGAAEAASKTFAGGLTQAQNALGDTKEEMGFVITKNQFFIELTHMATAEFKRWGEETQKNRGYLMDLAKDGVLTVVSSLKAGIETLRFFHNGWSGIKLVGQLAVQGLAFSLDALYPIIRSLLAPLDALYQGMVKLGVMDVNPFDAIGDGLATFKDSSAQVTKDVLADINKTNEKYDTISNTLQGYIDKIKIIPVVVAEITESEKKAHALRMGQIDAQLKAVTELSEKELKSLQEVNQKKYAMDIALANQVQEDVWLIREKGLKKAIKLHEDTQTKITQNEYDEAKRRNEKIEKAYEDSLKEQTRAHEQFVEKVQDVTADKFYDLFSSPRTFWKNALDEMTDYFYRLLAQWAAKAIAEPIIVPFIQQVGGGITSALGFGGSGGGGITGTIGNSIAGKILSPITDKLWGSTKSLFSSLGFGSNVALGGETLSTFAAGNGVADVIAPSATGASSGLGGMISAAAPAAFFAAYAMMASKIISGLYEDRPSVFFRTSDHAGYGARDTVDYSLPRGEGGYTEFTAPTGWGYGAQSPNFEYRIGVKDTGNDPEVQKQFFGYFDTLFTSLEENLGVSMNEVLKEHEYFGKGIRLNDQTIEDLSGSVFSEMLGTLLLDIFPDGGEVTKIVKQVTGATIGYYGGDPNNHDDVRNGDVNQISVPVYEDVAMQVSKMAEIFNEEFFKAIAPEGGNEWDSLVAFGKIVKDNETFMADFNRQMEEFGETAIDAFSNLSQIDSILAIVDSGIEAITTIGADSEIRAIANEWVSLISVLEKAHATTEELTRVEQGRNIALGAQLTGLTGSSIQSALAGGKSIDDILNTSVKNTAYSVIAQTIADKYVTSINEAVGQVWVDTSGDIEAVISAMQKIDTSEAQAEILALQKSFGILPEVIEDTTTAIGKAADVIKDAAPSLEDAVRDLEGALGREISAIQASLDILEDAVDSAQSVLESALSREISNLEKQRSLLEDKVNASRQIYIASLNAEIQKQQDLKRAAEQAAGQLESVIEALGKAKNSAIDNTESGPAYAKYAFEKALQKGFAGDVDALASLPDLAAQYREAATESASTRQESRAVSIEIYKQLETAQEVAKAHLKRQEDAVKTAELQLTILETQRDAINDINDTTLSIQEAAAQYQADQLALDQSGLDQQIGQHQARLDALNGITETVLSVSEAEKSLQQAQMELEQSGLVQQIDLYTQQLTELKSLNTNILSLAQAQANYNAALANANSGGGGNTKSGAAAGDLAQDDGFGGGYNNNAANIVLEAYNKIGRGLGGNAIGDGIHQIDPGGYKHWYDIANTPGMTTDAFYNQFNASINDYLAQNPGDAMAEHIKKSRGFYDGGTIYSQMWTLLGDGGEAEHVTPDSQMQGVKEELRNHSDQLDAVKEKLSQICDHLKRLVDEQMPDVHEAVSGAYDFEQAAMRSTGS